MRSDRALFLAARLIWPINNIALLVIVGWAYGQPAVADYTYALAACAPLYFLVSMSFPMFVAVRDQRSQLGTDLLLFRLWTVAATSPIAIIAWTSSSTQYNVLVALWLVKIGDILYEPVAAHIATRTNSEARGRQLLFADSSRLLVSQSLVWICIVYLDEGLVFLLVMMGIGNIAVALGYLLIVPEWHKRVHGFRETLSAWAKMMRTAGPMTASGATLALLIGLPRLMNESHMSEQEQAIFGIAQAAGSGIALIFNGGWLYELTRIKSALQRFDFWGIVRINVGLSLSFLGLLAIACVVLGLLQKPLFDWFGVRAAASLLLPALTLTLGLQHCISVQRDVLKLSGQVWTELTILLGALVTAVASQFVMVDLFGNSWEVGVATMCLAAIAVQIVWSYIALRRGMATT